MAVDCHGKLATVTLRKGLVHSLPIGGRREFIRWYVRRLSEFDVRQRCRTFVPVTFWRNDGCWANPPRQIFQTSNICGDAAHLPEHTIPSPADDPPIMVLRGISRKLVDPATFTNFALIIGASVLWVSFLDAACATISSSEDLALGSGVLALSRSLQVSEPFGPFGTRVDLLPGRATRN
jgi:hypothetical protein